MASNQGAVIQGLFIRGRPQIVGVTSPTIQMAAAQLSAQNRAVTPNVNQHAAHLQRMVQPHGSQIQGVHPQAMQLRSAADQGPAVQRVGNGEAFPLPANLSIFGGGGQPLPNPVREKMESFFNASFADVRVHVGAQASAIGALALAQGSNLYFAPGQYNPGTAWGQQLLGHELTHVVQQRAGRVRNPFGSGVAVVQDRGLEAEAERQGIAAALHQVSVQAKMANPRTNGAKAGSQGIHGSKPATIQRTIHHFKNGKWKVSELGTYGSFPKPIVEKDTGDFYFNDVNGKRGKTRREVRAGLADLMMITGSLTDKKVNLAWPPKLWKDLTELPFEPGNIVILGTVTLAPKMLPQFKPAGSDKDALLRTLWEDFLGKFMERNQQLPYIRRQSWFTSGEAEVDVDINFYPDRGYGAELSFHKDTAGDNLFVNLLFNNATPTPATEWIEDQATPLRNKRAEMKKLMPEGMRAEIRAARKGIRGQTHRPQNVGTIRGGIAPPAAYVSWVDELVWHATPSVKGRKQVSGNMANYLSSPGYYWSENHKTSIHRALHYLAKFPDTLIAKMDKVRKANRLSQGSAATFGWGFETTFVDSYIESVSPKSGWVPAHYDALDKLVEEYHDGTRGPNYKQHFIDVEKHRGELTSAPISLAIGQELAPDPGGIGTFEFNQRTRIHGRTKRANSVGDLKAALNEAYQDNLKRSFIRTWVRVRKVKKKD